MRKSLLSVAIVLPLLLGCGSKQERLEDSLYTAKVERAELIKVLYAEYGGGTIGDLAKEMDNPDEPQGFGATVKLALTDTEVALFEGHCVDLGRGEGAPKGVTAKTRQFFEQPSVGDRCRKVVKLDDRITTLEAELATAQGTP